MAGILGEKAALQGREDKTLNPCHVERSHEGAERLRTQSKHPGTFSFAMPHQGVLPGSLGAHSLETIPVK
jgi:hypothetical protein